MATTPKTTDKAALTAASKSPAARKAATTLPDSVFAVTITNHELLRLAYDSYLAAGRAVSAVTKRRGEVSGGGKKPWKQKGTGRARFGSSRNPIWRGGGIVFGPNGTENYTKRIAKGAKRLALRQALTLAKAAEKVVVTDITATGKTKAMATFVQGIDPRARRILLVVDERTPELERASRNIPTLELIRANYLSVYHILNADRIVMSPAALKVVEAWLGSDQKEVTS